MATKLAIIGRGPVGSLGRDFTRVERDRAPDLAETTYAHPTFSEIMSELDYKAIG